MLKRAEVEAPSTHPAMMPAVAPHDDVPPAIVVVKPDATLTALILWLFESATNKVEADASNTRPLGALKEAEVPSASPGRFVPARVDTSPPGEMTRTLLSIKLIVATNRFPAPSLVMKVGWRIIAVRPGPSETPGPPEPATVKTRPFAMPRTWFKFASAT